MIYKRLLQRILWSTVIGMMILHDVSVAAATVPAPFKTVEVSTSEGMKAAIKQAKAGDHILLANGTYRMDTVTAIGTAASPITIEAENLGKAVIASGSTILEDCSYLVVSGLTFTTDQSIVIDNSSNCRVTRNVFRLKEGSAELHWLKPLETSSYLRFDHNTFDGKAAKGNYISFGGTKGISQHVTVDHNYFKNIKNKGENGTEAIRIGLGAVSKTSGFAIIEYNLFENCDGDAEIISSKTSDNIIRYNTIKSSTGSISLRQGARGQVYGNTILGDNKRDGKSTTGGIKVYGPDHSIHDNYIEKCTGQGARAALVIDSGDADLTSTDDAIHCRVYRAKVYNNILYNNAYGLNVGGEKYGTYSPVDCRYTNNIVQQNANTCFEIYAEVNGIWKTNVAWPTGTAVAGSTNGVTVRNPKIDFAAYEKKALTAMQVGPSAP